MKINSLTADVLLATQLTSLLFICVNVRVVRCRRLVVMGGGGGGGGVGVVSGGGGGGRW